MAVRVSVVVGMFAFAFCGSWAPSLAQGAPKTSPPVVERELIVSDPSCIGSPSSPVDFTEAFATRVSSSRVLRFIAFLDRLPETEQMRVVRAIDALPKASVESQAERGCRTVAGVATMRALYMVANRWHVPLGGRGMLHSPRLHARSRLQSSRSLAIRLSKIRRHRRALRRSRHSRTHRHDRPISHPSPLHARSQIRTPERPMP